MSMRMGMGNPGWLLAARHVQKVMTLFSIPGVRSIASLMLIIMFAKIDVSFWNQLFLLIISYYHKLID